MESVMNTTTTDGFDTNEVTFDDSFIHKRAFSDDEWSMHSSENSMGINDTLDIYNYRIVENYNVNKVSPEIAKTPKYEVLDKSNLGWNTYFFDDSLNTSQLIDLEDTLNICHYRRASTDSNATETVSEETLYLTYESVVSEYTDQKSVQRVQHYDSMEFNQFSNVSTVGDFIWDQSSDLLYNSFTAMEDSLDVFSYRRKSSQQQISHETVPARGSIEDAKYFNRMVIPNHLFGTSSRRPMTSSPIIGSSNRRQR